MKPYVMITNDDGIASPGLKALAEALSETCDLLIVAPKYQQTNMGRGALRGSHIGSIDRHLLAINGILMPAYAVDGSPAQAVAHGILELADRQIDYCICGINYGENLGLAFTCSGTLGAAFEADSFGIPSIAFSREIPIENQRLDAFQHLDWEAAKFFVKKILKNVMKKGFAEGVRILNVNFPCHMTPKTKIHVTHQANMSLGMYVKPLRKALNKGYHLEWQLNDKIYKAEEGSDIYAIHVSKVVSVTPLSPIMSITTEQNCYYKKQI